MGTECSSMIGIALVEAFGYRLIIGLDSNNSKNIKKENKDAETVFLETNMRQRKWLIIGTYKSPNLNDSRFLENMSNNFSAYLKDCYNVLLTRDFNVTPENTNLQHFTDSFNVDNLIHEATSFKYFPVI